MTRPTTRVLALLEILQTGGLHTVGALAARLQVDERTVRRYIGHLVDLDIPVRSERGRYGGYRLALGFRMPPLMLTDDEAVAVLLGLVAGRRTGLAGPSPVASEAASAKLRRVLPAVLGRRVDDVLRAAEFADSSSVIALVPTDVLLTVAGAVRRRRQVSIIYTGGDGRRTERTLHPYGLVFRSGRWYVTGHDSSSGETRLFRLDRISETRSLDGTFEVPDTFDATQAVLTGLARMPYRHEIALRVRESVEEIRARLPAVVIASAEPGPDPDWTTVRIHAQRLDWIPGVLAGLGVPFVIDRPDELRGLVRSLAADLSAAAGDR
ncbi:MAG: YafY family protein [Nakamurella sp.]